jgi:VanZ family protein
MGTVRQHRDVGSIAITVGIIAVIVYGSLYPFRFYNNPNPDRPFRALLATWNVLGGRGDLIANFILYVPLGFFLARSIKLSPPTSILLAVAGGLSLSTGMELLQFFDVGRYSQMSDIYFNGAGTIVGATIGILSPTIELPGLNRIRRHDFVTVLLVCWLGYRLFPYVPVIDLHKYWDAIKPLFLIPSASAVDVYRHIVMWFAIATLLEVLIGVTAARLAAILLFVSVLLLRILMIDVVLSLPEVLGGVSGVLLWILILSRLRSRAVIVAGLFVVFVVLQALAPFNFSNTARPFGWLPFRGFLNGSNGPGVPSFFEKTFTYGCLVWLVARAGCSWIVATALGASLVFVLRLTQVYLPGRSAEITDVLLLLMVALIMKLMAENPQLDSDSHDDNP